MIIDGIKIAKITIKNQDGIVAILTDKEAKTEKGYDVSVVLDTSLGPDAIALTGDVLHYRDEPEKQYVVTQADDKFFTMTPVTIEKEKQEIAYDNKHSKTYPNNRKVGTLLDYGIDLEYRGDSNGSSEE